MTEEQRAPLERKDDEVPEALRAEVERDIANAITHGKIWADVLDQLFSPKVR